MVYGPFRTHRMIMAGGLVSWNSNKNCDSQIQFDSWNDGP